MKHLKIGFGFLAATMLTSSVAYAQVSEDEFQALLDSQKSSNSSEQVDSEEDDKEVKVESIDIPGLFKDIDNHEAQVRRLEQMVAIAELEQEYMELTGSAPEGALTLGSGDDDVSESSELESMLRSEISSLKRQIEGMASRMSQNQEPDPQVSQWEAMQEAFKASDNWQVKGISIYGDKRSAVIAGATGNNFVVRQGDDVGGVRVVSIEPEAVRVREDGKTTEIPLAGTSYADENVEMMPPGVFMGGGWDEGPGPQQDNRNAPISYPQVSDSTSR